jgi:DNA-directed RNA polymerases I and III subunit RPAC1
MNTLVFACNVVGVDAPPSPDADDTLGYTSVYSESLEWVPQGDQAMRFEGVRVGMVHDDILIAKLRPGQALDLELHAVKGIGLDHAKFSPVATASYRLMPQIDLVGEPFTGPEAKELVSACPMNVFDIEDLGQTARVANPRNCTMCRECLRPVGWNDRVKLSKVNDHFLFRVESTGALPAAILVQEAIKVRWC